MESLVLRFQFLMKRIHEVGKGHLLRKKQRAHLGLLAPSAELGANPTELEILRRRQAMKQEETRNDMAYAYVHIITNAVRSRPTESQVADTYNEAPNTRQNSGKLMDLLDR
jgi:hypothetical protein